MSGRRKRRVLQHLMEEESLRIIREILPSEWVFHEYRPDYGIDLSIEPFESVEEDTLETLGEHLFVQLKSVKIAKLHNLEVVSRQNVEKRSLSADASYAVSPSQHIEVLPFTISTNDLVTVQLMGAAAPVLLLLVPLDVKRVFFLCLNDLVDKVIIPDDPSFMEKDSKQIYIPASNEVTRDPASLVPIRMYAKRAKLYTAIAKIAYQHHELQYVNAEAVGDESSIGAYVATLKHFIRILKSLSVWDASDYWPLVAEYKRRIASFEAILNGQEKSPIGLPAEAKMLWQGLNALGRTFEEVAREWFLPTSLGASLRH